ncbi:hypothetical protein [Maridesulfovibrio salexigens]|uniref:Capsule polysaccharide biosynthesis protein n=1 Tax=Maridesulfovibrio salexigens (strain ATCC 14822 / DSM 2638 / NCIMB 8403 / VKM B-1763) TaxID=526222 RepID=C6BTK3_MARSD|nr:hypothetical protein [Maridesulfovibrio salexigens]ACS81684.1 hypothetical protein Desal_3638 [Maridesulfovibrio salexigens DSM 2638]
MNKHTILFMSRERCDDFFIPMVKELKKNFNIVVTVTKNNKELYSGIEGITIEEFHDHETMITLSKHITSQQLEKVKLIENDLDLNCYNFDINYLLYEKFVNRYHGKTILGSLNKVIPQRLLLDYIFLNSIIKKHNVEYAFFETLDLTGTMILDAMARKKIIKQAFAQQCHPFGGELRIRITSGSKRESRMIDYIYNSGNINIESIRWAEKAINRYEKEKPTTKYDSQQAALGRIIPRYSLAQIIDKAKRMLEGDSLAPALIKLKNRILSAKYLTTEVPEGNIISYFLQLTPEATTCAQTPEFANQEHMLEQIAIHGKYGYTVVIKEHPACYGNRDPKFYKELTALPNVVILSPSVPTRDIILRSKAVVVTTATSVAIECLATRIPVICLGKPFINICKNTVTVDKPHEVWDIIDSVKANKDEAIKFLAAMYQGTYGNPQYSHVITHDEIIERGKLTGKALKDEIEFYENILLN